MKEIDDKRTLASIAPGETCRIESVDATGHIRRRLFDLGFAPGAIVGCIGKSPLGDPRAYAVRGTTVAVRGADAIMIRVSGIKS